MGMAVTLGGVSSALVGFGGNSTEQGKLISQTTIDIVTCIYAPLSIVIMGYALFTYEWRAWFLRKKQVGEPSGMGRVPEGTLVFGKHAALKPP